MSWSTSETLVVSVVSQYHITNSFFGKAPIVTESSRLLQAPFLSDCRHEYRQPFQEKREGGGDGYAGEC